MVRHRGHLEPLADGFVAFQMTNGERWKHRDMAGALTEPAYRLFVSESGEERRYTFGPVEPHDVTLLDLREQVDRATKVETPARPAT